MIDQALRDEITKASTELAPLSGEAMQSMVENILKSPPGLVERMKEILGSK